MAVVHLSQQERDKFADWLEAEARDQDALAAQAEKIGAPKVIVSKMRGEALAAAVVAKKLRAIESMTIGGDE